MNLIYHNKVHKVHNFEDVTNLLYLDQSIKKLNKLFNIALLIG